MKETCTECGATYVKREMGERTWWHLENYYGICGFFCPDCFDKVSHNSYKQPINPGAYCLILLKQKVKVEYHGS